MIWNYDKYAELARIMQNDDDVYAYSLRIALSKHERQGLCQTLKELSELCMNPQVLHALYYGSLRFMDGSVRRENFVASVHEMIKFYKRILTTSYTWRNSHKQAA